MEFSGSRERQKSLRKIISEPVLVITISVLLLCQFSFFVITGHHMQVQSYENVKSQLNSIEKMTAEKITDVKRMLFGIQVNDTFDQALRKIVFDPEQTPVYFESEISRVLAVNKGTQPLISNIYVCSKDFIVTDMTTLLNHQKSYLDSEAYRMCMENQETVLLGNTIKDDIFLTEKTVVPVGYRFEMPGYGNEIAVFANVDQDRFNEFLKREVSDQGFIAILNQDGKILFENQSVLGKEAADKFSAEEFSEGNIISKGHYVAGVQPIKNTSWQVMYLASEMDTVKLLFQIGTVYTLISVGAVVLLVLLLIRKIRSITKPIEQLSHVMAQSVENHYEETFSYSGQDELRILSDSFNQMVEKTRGLLENQEMYIEKLQQQQKKVKAEQKLKRKAELKALQAQINPHFLYNTLDSIRWKAEEAEADEISEMVQALASFFRINLSKGKEMISLEEEVCHVTSYLRIQQIRYGDQLCYHIHMEEGLLKLYLPKLILQPLVENAIYHGIKEKEEPGTIWITGYEEDEEHVTILVEDDGIGISEENIKVLQEKLKSMETVHQEGYGIFNVNERIRLYFGTEYGIELQNREGGGTIVRICLPKVLWGESREYVSDNNC